ncbi:MAG: hypothetical protein SFY32_15340 [Bacteroidota bacterium]|nr:hypothetical protein [Bacteroidota bacterium]
MFFWQKWESESRYAYWVLLFVFGISIVSFLYYFFFGQQLNYQWVFQYESDKIPVVIDSFSRGIFTFNIEADSYITTRQFSGSDFQIFQSGAILSYAIIVFSLLVIITTASFLNNWLYYLITSVAMLFFVFQQPTVLVDDFNYDNFFKIAPIVLFGLPSYYFFAYNHKVKFIYRLVVFLLIYVVYFGAIRYFSNTIANPAFFLLNYGLLIALIISLLFILFVAYEILYFFLYLISNNKSSGNGNGTRNFIIITILYLSNLLLNYLKNTRQIDWDVVFISPFIILLFSAILGMWGIKERTVMYQKLLPFYPFGGIIYLAWAAICLTTIGYCFSTANDSMIEVFEDAILFSHIGFGFGLFLYVFMLYRDWINADLPVNKLIYSNPRSSFLTVWGAGFVVFITMFFYGNMFPYYQSIAGYYSALGDSYYADKQDVLAEDYYKKSVEWEFQNHKANYALATMLRKSGKNFEASNYYKKATLKQATPFAYANWALLSFEINRKFDALFTLREGIKEFPKSGELHNNIAVLFQQLTFYDSSIVYINKAEKLFTDPYVPRSNKLALFTKLGVVNTDLLQTLQSNDKVYLTNQMAFQLLSNANQTQSKNSFIQPDSALNNESFNYLTNYTLSNLNALDTNFINTLHALAIKDTNAVYRSDLFYLKAIANYYTGNVLIAMKSVDDLQLGSDYEAGTYLNTLGLWTLQNNVPKFASDIFQLAADKGNNNSLFNKSLSLCETGKFNEAVNIWNRPEIKNNKDYEESLNKVQIIFSIKDKNMLNLSNDPLKYAFLYYRMNELNDNDLGNTFFSIKSDTFKFKTGILLFDKYYKNKDYAKCSDILSELKPISKDKYQNMQYEWSMLQYFEAINDKDELKMAFQNTVINDKGKLAFIKGRIAELEKDEKQAIQQFTIAARMNPFNEQILLKSANYLQNTAKQSEKAFNILLNGITLNKYSVALYKAYCLQAIAFGIPSFADNGLNNLRDMLSKQEFQAFEKQLEKAKSEMYANF